MDTGCLPVFAIAFVLCATIHALVFNLGFVLRATKCIACILFFAISHVLRATNCMIRTAFWPSRIIARNDAGLSLLCLVCNTCFYRSCLVASSWRACRVSGSRLMRPWKLRAVSSAWRWRALMERMPSLGLSLTKAAIDLRNRPLTTSTTAFMECPLSLATRRSVSRSFWRRAISLLRRSMTAFDGGSGGCSPLRRARMVFMAKVA